MTPILAKKKQILIGLWIVFSIAYICFDLWSGFKINVMQSSYQAGGTDVLTSLIKQAQNKECKSFNVYVGDNKVDLVNVECLKQSTGTGNTTPSTK